MQEQHHLQTYYVLLMSLNVTATLVIVAACLWCNKKTPKNELLGLEGMVKLKNPDEVIVVAAVGSSESQAELNASTASNADSEKRASTAAHRSLPDIPLAETSGDDGSDLYETQISFFNNATHNLKKQSSISQHSSISQADDSPYSRVKNSPHDYAKVRATEHPYAQLNAPNLATTAAAATNATGSSSNPLAASNDTSTSRNSHHSNTPDDAHDAAAPQVEIPAASAIAGMVSASQDLPYMTPPIANQHFSGDSQDSSKGYTSISVREPLANILGSQPPPKITQRIATLSRDAIDSHYTTVSDDSDETYAAIEDPTGRSNPHDITTTDIYTSGSETYAQIQPMQCSPIVVSVEINNSASTSVAPIMTKVTPVNAQSLEQNHSSSSSTQIATTRSNPAHSHNRPISDHVTPPVMPHVDSLRAQMHSRQASLSSNNSASCVSSLGSPKPEKRQANSPLPPTPKSNQLRASSNSNLTSGRNSVISVIESGGTLALDTNSSAEYSPQKKQKSLSPSKDIEGMYAKVMKKAKFSRNSQSPLSNSPVLARKFDHSLAQGASSLDATAAVLVEAHSVNVLAADSSSRMRSNSYDAKDHGYETIPADAIRSGAALSGSANSGSIENRKSDCYTHFLQKERQLEGAALLGYSNAIPPIDADNFPPDNLSSDKYYETIAARPKSVRSNNPNYESLVKLKSSSDPESEKKCSEYDPNYEVLKDPQQPHVRASAKLSDDGYAKVIEKKLYLADVDGDSIDGYSKVKGEECDDGAVGGYSTISEAKDTDANHNYASILETKGCELKKILAVDSESDHYARIAESREAPPPIGSELLLTTLSTPTKSWDDVDTLSPRLPELQSITSPSSVNSSLQNNSCITTSTISSRQTPSSSQYESLTGSDTDPNYESVCYINNSSVSENPYERLQPDYSDTQLSSPSSLTTPEESRTCLTTKCAANGGSKTQADSKPNMDIVVDDYFQV